MIDWLLHVQIHPESYDLAKKLICKEGFEARRDLGREGFRRRFQTLTKDQDGARKVSAELGAEEATVKLGC